MKKRLLISLALACCFAPLLSESQNLSINKIDALKNGARLIYVNENGDYFGCGIKLECMPFSVKMYSITFDKKSNIFTICGNVFVDGISKDTVTVGGVSILIAKPLRDTLTNVRFIGNTIERKGKNIYPYRRGDFKIEFIAESNDKLYFSHPIFSLIEYDIGKLVSALSVAKK